MSEWLSFAAFLGQRDPYDPYKLYNHILYNVMIIYPHMIKQGKSEGFDSCDRPSNLTQTGFVDFPARVTLKFDG